MDLIRALSSLVPDPKFKGTMKDNTEAQYKALKWTDGRKKPTLAKLRTEDARLAVLDTTLADEGAARERIKKRSLEQQKAEATVAGDAAAATLLDSDIAALSP